MMQASDTASEPSTHSLGWRCRIDQVMRPPTITIGPDESVEKAASLMARHGIHALPVTNSQQKLLGMITTTDVMQAALHPSRQAGARAATQQVAATAALTAAEMSHALSLATAATEGADEKAEIARALVHACARLSRLEALRSWADRYVHVRLDERLHGVLIRAEEQTRRESASPKPLSL
jgi:CBS-domain-containing membrane protein